MHKGYGISALVFAVTSVLPLVGCSGESTTTTVNVNACSNITYAAPSGAANNIVFTFDKAYICGQFANGDWWVAGDTGGSVTITSITPAASGGRNGFEVNPTSTSQQAFDSNASVTYNAALMPALPLTVSGVSSVVKAVYRPATVPPSPPELQFAAVLTVVSAPVVNSSEVFRPGYFGATGKTFYTVPSSATVSGLPVATHTPVGVPSTAGFTIASIATRYRHVQMDHSAGWAGRDMHPADNMPDYGADIASDNAVYLLRMLLSDFNYSDTTHKQALVNYLQMAIDLKSIAAGGGRWDADGGHGNGRKLPLRFAHMVFGGTDFSNAIAASAFSEDQQVYRSSVTGEVLWGKAGIESYYWRTTRGALGELTASGAKDIRDYYGRIDGGGYQVGVSSEYQVCCTSQPWKYTVLALYMLGLESPPANLPLSTTNNLVEYVERWVRYGVKANDTMTNINLTTGAITQGAHGFPVCMRPAVPPARPVPAVLFYGVDYGPDVGGDCIGGVNNWTGTNNTSMDGGGYGNTFGDELWAWYR